MEINDISIFRIHNVRGELLNIFCMYTVVADAMTTSTTIPHTARVSVTLDDFVVSTTLPQQMQINSTAITCGGVNILRMVRKDNNMVQGAFICIRIT